MANNDGLIDGRRITDEGARALQIAIIQQAVRDWKALLTMRKKQKETYCGDKPPFAFQEIRRFFQRGGNGLLDGCALDPEIILLHLENLLIECDASSTKGLEN